MKNNYYQIIDANINRVTEGLRVIEEYTRFLTLQKKQTDELAKLRREISQTEKEYLQDLLSRGSDVRAAEPPPQRKDLETLLRANFKRIEQGLRVLEEYTGNPFYTKKRFEIYALEKEILLSLQKKNIKPGIYLISDDEKNLEQGLKWEVSAIQLRDKKNSKKVILQKAFRIQEKAKRKGIPLIINDYIDIALACDADGFHSGQDDISIKQVRDILGPHKIIGRSTHILKEGIQAERQGADYIGIGPIWSTISKPEYKAIGFDYLKKAKEQIHIPYVAIGDINFAHMSEIFSFLPPNVALIRAYKEIPEIQKKYF